jgi:hypothetical protein
MHLALYQQPATITSGSSPIVPQLLDQAPGLRGWYAAVVHPGLLLANTNTIVRCLDDAKAGEA